MSFGTTIWTNIGDAKISQQARLSLVASYFTRIDAYARKRWSAPLGNDFDDVLQSFFEKLLAGRLIQKADRAKGRFRSLLMKAFDNHVRDYLRASQRRADLVRFESNLDSTIVSNDDVTSQDRIWAEELFRQSVAILKERCGSRDGGLLWEVARQLIVDPILKGVPVPLKADVAKRLQTTTGTVSGKHRTARQYLQCITIGLFQDWQLEEVEIRQEMADYVRALASVPRHAHDEFNYADVLYSDVECDLAEFDPEAWNKLPCTTHLGGPEVITYDDLYHHPSPPADWLRLTKDFAKSRIRSPDQFCPSSAAALLYYLAIGTALRRCRRPISSLSNEQLLTALRRFLHEPGVDARYKCLFRELLDVIDEKTNSRPA